MNHRATIGAYFLLIAACNFAVRQALAQGFISTIAVTGQQAAGLPAGVQYRYVQYGSRISLNAAGQFAFPARLMGAGVTQDYNDAGIWMGVPGAIDLLARKGDAAPGVPTGAVFSQLSLNPSLSADGQAVFQGFISGPGIDSTNNTGIWRGAPGDLTLVARAGDPAPGTPPGVKFGSIGAGHFFRATLTGPGVTTENDAGYWLVGENGLTLIAREGDQAPGVPTGVRFGAGGYPSSSFVADDAGRVAFRMNLTGTGMTADNDIGLWLKDTSGTALIARQGDPAPGLGPGVVYRLHPYNVDANEYTEPVLAAGQIAFETRLGGPGITTENDHSIWVGPPENITLRVRDGQMAPGTNLPFRRLGTPRLNDAGEFAFVGVLDSTSLSDYQGIWGANAEGLRLIARQGEPAPDSDGLVYGDGISGILYNGYISINSAGHIAFGSQLNQGSGYCCHVTNGIWLDQESQQIRVVGGGDVLAGRPVVDVALDSNNFEFNDRDQLFFLANFAFASDAQGLFLYSPGLPGDFNADLAVDAADYIVWRNGLGGLYTQSDYDVWKSHFGAVSPGIGAGSGESAGVNATVPEPTTGLTLLLGVTVILAFNWRGK